jgi:hypothetical protein
LYVVFAFLLVVELLVKIFVVVFVLFVSVALLTDTK